MNLSLSAIASFLLFLLFLLFIFWIANLSGTRQLPPATDGSAAPQQASA